MPEPENERDAAMLDSEIKESENELDLDNNADTHDGAAESENENNEDGGTQANDGKERQVETHSVTAENLSARRGQFARADEPYDWNRCTTVITLQVMPPRAEQEAASRKVFLSVRTHADPPHTLNMRWSDLEPRLPEEIKVLLTRVQQDLPQRAAKRAAADQAERQRQEELEAQAEKRAAEKKAKGQSITSATRGVKHNKRVDLNAPPALPASQAVAETDSAPAPSAIDSPTNAPSQAVQPVSVDANPEATVARAQMSLF